MTIIEITTQIVLKLIEEKRITVPKCQTDEEYNKKLAEQVNVVFNDIYKGIVKTYNS